jgi:hypothetical protein
MRRSFFTECRQCGGTTNIKYARTHGGLCKSCREGVVCQRKGRYPEGREAFIIDHGWQAYAREEGHYDLPDNY